MARKERAEVPEDVVRRLDAILSAFPSCAQEPAWTGVRWRVGGATVAHVFGGEDQLIRLSFRGEMEEVYAFRNLGPPYYQAEWGRNVIGLVLSADTDWEEVAELLTDSYCLQAPEPKAAQVRDGVPGTRAP